GPGQLGEEHDACPVASGHGGQTNVATDVLANVSRRRCRLRNCENEVGHSRQVQAPWMDAGRTRRRLSAAAPPPNATRYGSVKGALTIYSRSLRASLAIGRSTLARSQA